MGKFKKLITFAAALSMAAAIIPAPLAAIPQYAQELTETFDYDSVDELLANSSVIQNITNQSYVGTLALPELTSKSGKALQIKSCTDSDNVVSTKAILKYDVTVVDFQLRGTAVSGGYARVALRDNTTYTTSGKAPLLSFERNGTTTVLQDFMSADRTVINTYNSLKWYPIRLIFDRPNKTVTVTIPRNTTVYTYSKTFDAAWDDSAYLTFQTVYGSTLRLDDIIVSDGFYLNDIYIDQDFEHTNVIGAIGSSNQPTFFPGITSDGNININYDAALNNTYASLPAQRITYSNNATGVTPPTDKPVVIEYSLKTDKNSTVTPAFYKSGSGTYAFAPITNGVTTAAPYGGSSVDVSDGLFHTYRITLKRTASGYTATLLIDNAYRGYYAGNSFPENGRFQFAVASDSSDIGLDNFKIYYPAKPAVLSNIEDGAVNAAVDSSIVLKGNNPFNFSSFNVSLKNAVGETVAITKKSESAANTLTIVPTGGLEPNTTYTLTIPSTAKDMFDQYYTEQTITFTTEELDPVEASLTYTIDGQAVEDGKFYSGEMQIKLDVTANTSAGANLLAAAAQYDSNGQLINVALTNSVLTGKGTDSKTASMAVTQTENTTVRLFCWEAETLTPFASPIDLMLGELN